MHDDDWRCSVDVKVFGYMGVDMRWIRSATEIAATIKGSVPIKGELTVDAEDSKLKVKYEQPTSRVKLFSAKVSEQTRTTACSKLGWPKEP